MTSATNLADPAASAGKALPWSRRTLAACIVIFSLLALAATVAVLAIGGRPDPAPLRAAAPLLGGPWRFHIGDDLRWAHAELDDSGWETVDLTAPASSVDDDVGLPNYLTGWRAHGHPGYQGYAWYRRMVTVPAGGRAWDILGPPAVDDGYELYWNGVKLGGLGRLGESPKLVGRRPTIFALPANAADTQGVLAIRTFMQRGHTSTDSGGIRVAPSLAPQPESRALYRVQWWRTIAGYIIEVVEPLAMFAAAGMALAVRRRSSQPDFITFVCIALVLSGVKRLDNAIVSWTDLMSLPTYSWLTRVLWTPLSVAAWALAWNRWCLRWRIIDIAALGLGVLGAAAGAMQATALTQIFRFGLLALLVLIAVGMVRGGPLRLMAAATMILITVSQFTGELRSLGVQDIWFPFGIGVTLVQYIYAIAIPLLALLIVRTLDWKDARS